MGEMVFDLAVIGGGPAGCAASIRAARSGARVLLLDRGKFPRHKVCGEFVSAESLHLLADLLCGDLQDLLLRSLSISEAKLFLDGRTLRAGIKPVAASITRFDLDEALWNAALAAGVESHSETTVRRVERSEQFWLAVDTQSAKNQVFEARATINASGRWSNFTSTGTRAQLNRNRWIGIKAHFLEPSAASSVDLYFFDGGYCGVQPIGSGEDGSGTRINACGMVRADVASTLTEVLNQDAALRRRAQSWQPLTDPVSTSPLVFHDPETMQNSMLQVGDAAAFVDPFVGDGISLALRSGALAAECLAPFFSGECLLAQASARYSREYERQLGHVFKTSSTIRRLLRWPRTIRRPVLSLLARAPFLTEGIVRMTR